MGNTSKKQQGNPPQGKKLSLSPLDFDEAVTDLLQISPSKPEQGSAKKKPTRKGERPASSEDIKSKR